jgi:hypothetical protein
MSKRTTETKEMNTQKRLPAVQYDNPFLEAAAEAGGEFGRILKFVKGEWQIGEDTVPEGTEYVAYLDQLLRGWVQFADGAVVDRRIERVATGVKLPNREELGNTDPQQWEKDDSGVARDPWVKQWFLPMTSVETDDCAVFITGSRGGSAAIGSLCRVYGRTDRKGLLPIIALKTRSYKHRQYGKIETPDLPIVGWHGAPPIQTATPPAQLTPHAGSAVGDMDDEVPF